MQIKTILKKNKIFFPIYFGVRMLMEFFILFRFCIMLKERPSDKDFCTFRPRSNRVYVLGCGPSINDLTTDNFNMIDEGFSVALNGWCNHWFRPSVLLVESGRKSWDDSIRMIKNCCWAKRTCILVKDIKRSIGLYAELSNLGFNVSPAFGIRIPGWDVVSMGRAYWLTDFLFSWCSIPYSLRVSCVQAMWIAYHQGASEIVLCGIDLKGQRGFWECSRNDDSVHETDTEVGYGITASQAILMTVAVMEKKGVRVLVGSTQSRLSRDLPVVSWS